MTSRPAGLSLVLVTALCAPRLEGGTGCEGNVSVVFQAQPLGSSPDPFAGAVEEIEIVVPRDAPLARHTVAAAIVSELSSEAGGGLCQCPSFCEPCTGLQGWSVSVALDGDLTLVGAGIEEVNPPLTCGYHLTELIDPEQPGADGEPQGQGVVSAVVFWCAIHTTLYPRGTETVLGITVEAERPAAGRSVSGVLRCRDRLRGSGEPVTSLATINGQAQPFCECRELAVRFAGPGPSPFRRCDVNDDGRHNISDAVWILRELFQDKLATRCPEAADCNADGARDLSDAVYMLSYQFAHGAPPPGPFPDCGRVEGLASEDCPPGSTSCR